MEITNCVHLSIITISSSQNSLDYFAEQGDCDENGLCLFGFCFDRNCCLLYGNASPTWLLSNYRFNRFIGQGTWPTLRLSSEGSRTSWWMWEMAPLLSEGGKIKRLLGFLSSVTTNSFPRILFEKSCFSYWSIMEPFLLSDNCKVYSGVCGEGFYRKLFESLSTQSRLD